MNFQVLLIENQEFVREECCHLIFLRDSVPSMTGFHPPKVKVISLPVTK